MSYAKTIRSFLTLAFSFIFFLGMGDDGIHYINPTIKDKVEVLSTAPFGAPIKRQDLLRPISSGYGMRLHPTMNKLRMHYGLDFPAEKGSSVISTSVGVVDKVGYDAGYGRYVVIKSDMYKIYYAHCSKIVVIEGDRIERGQEIAKVGSTGRSTGPHVHYEIHRNGIPVNPEGYVR